MANSYTPGRLSGRNQQNRSRLMLAGLAAAGAMAWINRNGGFSQVLGKVKDQLNQRGMMSGQQGGQGGSAGAQGLMGSGTAMGGQAPQAGTSGSMGGVGAAHTASGADASGSLNAGIADENTIPDRLPSGTLA